MLSAGQPAPLFELPDADLELFNLLDALGRHLMVLYFYAKDDTPGCTAQAIEFSDLEEEFRRCDCSVLGVSRDECFTHADFRDKHGLTVRLLSDLEGEVSRRYGVWREREIDGKLRFCMTRSTFIIDRKGVIRHAEYGVNPRGHAGEILERVRALHTKGIRNAHQQELGRHPQVQRDRSGRQHGRSG
ncbi:MAG: peroxiredoxin [Methyloversatilis sp.]|jgi:peroxiredoxin|uniref:thioredoxin-dependent peroxiredoxin n=1 Tax=Methyloversatilis universalis (strain ATCC BAA-1314 / DSM 25237 / JCM 13912 / CCUG 52030 / FAM5) TaxID=1000565 RepID=F5R989_METUF|nr:peroxiredoxin [Methyloversatilis universalis]EGK72880.1 Alkyl hydroperoxide reductase [Methyloversatilis universalis FAM5]MCP4638524.1 peroxiredoxin [Methyloversatilis sp.]